MPAYKCKIAMQNGDIVEKVLRASSTTALKEKISSDNAFLIHSEKAVEPGDSLSLFQPSQIKSKAFYSFNQELLTLLRAGLSVVSAFDTIIEKLEYNFFSQILSDIRDDISSGESVANAFEKYKHSFSPLYIAMLRSGEASGNIPDAIEAFLEHFERSRIIRQKVVSASVYPAILTLCSLGVIVFLMVYIVPAITGTFSESSSSMPFFTGVLIQASLLIKQHFLILALILILVTGLTVYFFRQTVRGRLMFDAASLKLPLFGPLNIMYATALFSSSLSTILKGGMPLNKALNISKTLLTNLHLQQAMIEVVRSVERGNALAASIDDAQLFPDMAVRMISAGEESGNLEMVLLEIARFYEREVENKLTVITSAVEPMLMVIMGFVIGFILLAMYMPIFQMAGTIGY